MRKTLESKYALFISSLSPGKMGGGAISSLALAQAVSLLHGRKMMYLGPPFMQDTHESEVIVDRYVPIGSRSTLDKAIGFVTMSHVDRISSGLKVHLAGVPKSTLVYVNGESAGRCVSIAKSLGFQTVYWPHNYAHDYLAAETGKFDLFRRVYNRILCKCALAGYRDSDFRLCFTKSDRIAYEQATGVSGNYLDTAYFARDTQFETGPANKRFTILINANLSSRQNIEGVQLFFRDIWPRIEDRPWQIIVAGRNPAPEVYAAVEGKPSVELVARPSNEEMEELFRQANVTFAPTAKGSGIKGRVMESLRRGVPSVCSTHCAIGYDFISRNVLRVYEEPAVAVEALEYFAEQSLTATQQRCLDEFREHLSFESGLERLSVLRQTFGLPQ
jgi:glycosyltransferase involved in cell wall biosynthesis